MGGVDARPGLKGARLRNEWRLWRSRAQDFNYEIGEVAADPHYIVMPEALGWSLPGQLALFPGESPPDVSHRLGPFKDQGDVALILETKRLGFEAILTVDLKSFWQHRGWLYERGIEVWRPSDFCWCLWNNFDSSRGWGVDPLRATSFYQQRRAA